MIGDNFTAGVRMPVRAGSTVRTSALTLVALGAAATVLAGCSAGKVSQTADKIPSIEGVNAQANKVAIRNAAVVFPAEEEAGYPAGGSAPLTMVLANESAADTLVSITSPFGSATRASAVPADAPADGAASDCVTAGAEAAASGSASPSGDADASGSASPSRGTAESGPAAPSGSAAAPSGSAAAPSGTAEPSAGASGSAEAKPEKPAEPAGPPVANLAVPTGLVKLSPQCPHVSLSGLKKPITSGTIVPVTLTFKANGPVTLQLPVLSPTTPLHREPAEKEEGHH